MALSDAQRRATFVAVLFAAAYADLPAQPTEPAPAMARAITIEAGIPLATALDQLGAQGARIVYSTALVLPSFTVRQRITDADAVALARRLLAPFGLELRPVGNGVFGIVEMTSRRALRGRVLDAAGGQPIRRARVECIEDGYVDWSDAHGGFSVRIGGRGSRSIRVSADGFDAKTVRVEMAAVPASPVDVRLRPAAAPLDHVTVVASRFIYDDALPASSFSIDRAEIVAQPKIGDDALQSIARLPGVAFSGVSGRPNVRGGEPHEALVVLDGMPLREAFHLANYTRPFSVIDDTLVARLDAYTGTLPVRYGNRLAAVVELSSLSPRIAPPRSIGVGTYNARARGAWAQTGGRSLEALGAARIGTLRAWLDEYSPDVGRPAYGDFFGKLAGATGRGTAWRTQAFGSRSELEYFDPDTTERVSLASEADYLWLNVSRALGERVELHGLLGYTRIDSERRGTLAGGLTPEGRVDDVRASRLGDAALRAVWRVSPGQTLEAGVALTYGSARYRYAGDVSFDPVAQALFGVPEQRARSHDLTAHRGRLALFLGDRLQLSSRWFIEAGGRLDHELAGSGPEHATVSPRVAVRWDAGSDTTWRLGWSRAYQGDEVHELRVEDGVTTFARPQRADQTVLSVEHRPLDGLALRAEGFERRMANPRTRFENALDPLRLIPDLSPDRIAVSPDASRLRGLEVSMQWQRGEWSMSGAYTRAEAIDEFAGVRVPRDWDQRDTIAAAATWRRGRWTASLFGAYHSGRPATVVESADIDAPVLGARNAARLGPYLSVDLRVAREWPLSRGHLAAYLQVTNLLDRDNPCCTELDLPDEDTDPARLEVERISAYPLLPALGVTFEF
ncbi:MAG: TonB-dependent receptor [Steroidobacteraceae bacterium]